MKRDRPQVHQNTSCVILPSQMGRCCECSFNFKVFLTYKLVVEPVEMTGSGSLIQSDLISNLFRWCCFLQRHIITLEQLVGVPRLWNASRNTCAAFSRKVKSACWQQKVPQRTWVVVYPRTISCHHVGHRREAVASGSTPLRAFIQQRHHPLFSPVCPCACLTKITIKCGRLVLHLIDILHIYS